METQDADMHERARRAALVARETIARTREALSENARLRGGLVRRQAELWELVAAIRSQLAGPELR